MPGLSDITGSDALVERLIKHVIEPIKKNPKSACRRIILYGPPGMGKTFVVKCVAGELGLKFRRVTPYDALNDLKSLALSSSGQILLYFEELEWINYRPVYMEALIGIPDDVLVIGGTNYPWRVQKMSAMGFASLIFLNEPGLESRKAIIKHNIGGMDGVFDIDKLVKLSEGFSPSDIYYIFEGVGASGEVTSKLLESSFVSHKPLQLIEWVDEAKKHKGKLDKIAFAPLLKWLDEKG